MEPTFHNQLTPRPSPLAASAAPQAYARGNYSNPYPADSDFASDSESGGLVEYWRILRRRRGTLILIAFLGLCAALLVTLPQTPVYRARTALEIQNVNADFLNSKQINPVSEGDSAMNVLTDVQTQMKILQSEALIDRVIDKMKAQGQLAPLATESGRLAFLKPLFHLKPPQPADTDYKIRQKAGKSLTVRQMGQTRVVEVLYNSTDPAFAAAFANTLASEYIDSNMEARWKMSQHTGEWLSRELDDMRSKLELSDNALQEYARRSGLLFTTPPSGNATEKTNVSEDKLRQLQEALSKAQADRAAAQSRYDIARTAAPDSLADVLNDDPLRDLQAKLTDLRRERAELITTYTPKHEKVQRVEAQIAPLEAAFQHQRDAILSRIRNDYDTALRNEKLLAADYTAQTHVVTDQADKSIQYNILKRDVDSNRQLYENMLQQVKEASVASAIHASNIRLVDPAKLPHKPYSPDYPLNSALGLLSGLLIGVAFVIVRERADRTLQEPGDAQFWTNLPELGVIPSESVGASSRNYLSHYTNEGATQTSACDLGPISNSDDSADPTGLIGAPGVSNAPAMSRGAGFQPATPASSRRIKDPRAGVSLGSSGSIELITWNRKPSLMAEAFRTVLTSIMFAGENGSRPRVLVLTSASPMDGKTTVVSNLGIAMAEIRQNVLIIDADLRKPRMHQLFDLPNERGLSTLLRENSFAPETLDQYIQKTAIPGLHVLPSGPSTYAAANLLYALSLEELLKAVKQKYDMVLIDTPPSLQMTDARVVGRLSDAVIFVARANRTTRDAAIAVHGRFAEDRTRVLGTILNDWNPKQSRSGYYGYYKNSYYNNYNSRYGGYLGKSA